MEAREGEILLLSYVRINPRRGIGGLSPLYVEIASFLHNEANDEIKHR